MSRTRDIRRGFSFPALLIVTSAFGMLNASASGVRAQTPPPAQTPSSAVKREHVVKKGDTLWDLASLYYGNPFLWKIIYDANKPVVENPHWIYPVEKLIIPGRDMTRPMPLGQPIAEPAPAPIQVTVEPVQAKDTTPTVLGTPDMSRIMVSSFEYLTAPWLSQNPEPGIVARIIRLADPTVSSDKIAQQVYPHDKVLLGDIRGTFRKGDSVQIIRLGRGMGTYGRIVEPLAVLSVDSVGTTVIAATVVRLFGPAKIGDFAMAMGAPLRVPRGAYTTVEAGPEGNILEFLNLSTLHGPGDLAFISFGSDQVRIGDELTVYTPEQRIDNVRPDILPKTTVGVVRVVKVTDHSATVRVIDVRNTGMKNGLLARLVRRAP